MTETKNHLKVVLREEPILVSKKKSSSFVTGFMQKCLHHRPPISRILFVDHRSDRSDDYLSGIDIAINLKQSTRPNRVKLDGTYAILHRRGFAPPPSHLGNACALTSPAEADYPSRRRAHDFNLTFLRSLRASFGKHAFVGPARRSSH